MHPKIKKHIYDLLVYSFAFGIEPDQFITEADNKKYSMHMLFYSIYFYIRG